MFNHTRLWRHSKSIKIYQMRPYHMLNHESTKKFLESKNLLVTYIELIILRQTNTPPIARSCHVCQSLIAFHSTRHRWNDYIGLYNQCGSEIICFTREQIKRGYTRTQQTQHMLEKGQYKKYNKVHTLEDTCIWSPRWSKKFSKWAKPHGCRLTS